MKKFIVYYKPRGAEFKFQSPMTKTVNAINAKSARSKLIDWIGDVYKVVKVVEVK